MRVHVQGRSSVFQPDKFGAARLTPVPSTLVAPPRVAECPVQLEAVIERMHSFGPAEDMLMAMEARILRIHVDDALLVSRRLLFLNRKICR